MKIDTIVFDLGNVLIDWNPKYLFLKEFSGDVEKTNWFLNHVCNSEWNLAQDAGRTFEEANQLTIKKFPAYEKQIKAFFEKWDQMCIGSIDGTLAIFEALKKTKKYKCFALTNFSAETWPIAIKKFPYLTTFDGVVVSGIEKTIKPKPEIYKILFERFHINPKTAVFIDDKLENIETAIKLGMSGIQFQTPAQLNQDLKKLNIQYE